MEILPKTQVDFDSLAEKIANEFYTQGTNIEDGVVKLATERNFNPEEVRRLVEKSNKFAAIKMLKTAKDKKVEIDLAKYASVLARTHPTDEASEQDTTKTASEIPHHFEDIRRREFYDRVEVFSKKASEENFNEQKATTARDIFVSEQQISKLKQAKLACELEIKGAIESIISEYSRWEAPEFSKFAEEAFTLHGAKAVPVLQKIAEYIDESIELEKVSHVIDTTENTHIYFSDAIETFKKLTKIAHDLTKEQNNLRDIWASVRKA